MEKEKNEKVLSTHVGQKAVLYNDNGEFLILKANEGYYSKTTGQWDFAGGRINHDEAIADAFAREIAEELGDAVTYEEKDLISIDEPTQRETGEWTIRVAYLAKYVGGDILLSEEHEEYAWVGAEEVANDKKYKPWVKQFVAKAAERIEKLEAHEKMLRTLAEFDNYKKRSAENQKDFAAYASEKVIMEMLPVLDNFHAATAHVPEDQKDSPWLTGIMFIQQQMDKVFEDQGVNEIAVAVGDVFNEQAMEAVEEGNGEKDSEAEEKQSLSDKEKVVKIIQKGYKLKEKILRPARVVVG